MTTALHAQNTEPPVAEVLPELPLQPEAPTDVTTANFQEEYGRIVNGGEAVNAIDMGQFGESVDLSSGRTEFTATDVSLPGNSALPVAFGRSRSIDNHGGTFTRTLGDWDMDIPYMEGVYIKGQWGQTANPQGWIVDVSNPALRQNRCSAPASQYQMPPPAYATGSFYTIPPKEFWQGIHLHAPGQGRQEVLFADALNPKPSDGLSYRYVTSGRWYLACDNGLPDGQPGDGYIARSPDGLIYRFNRLVTEDYAPISREVASASTTQTVAYDRQRIRLYPGSVEDRYGNVVTYTWSAGKLTSIAANDGRTLTLAWNGVNGASCTGSTGVLCSVSDGTRTWSYGYTLINSGPYSRLTSVTLPDTSQWTLDFSAISWGQMLYQAIPPGPGTNLGYDTALGCNWMRLLGSNQRTVTIGHPSGASAAFAFDVKRHGRTKVNLNCNEVTGPSDRRGHFPDIPARFDAWSITSKSVTGPGIASPYVWSYSYALPIGSFLAQPGQPQNCPTDPLGACPLTKAITVTAPDGSYSVNTYGIEWEKNDGQLLSVATYSAASALKSATAYTYVTDAQVAGEPFQGTLGGTPQWYLSDSWQAERVRPQRSRVTTQDGVNFSWAVSLGGFDTYARPATVVKSASPGSSKTEVTAYENNTAKWVVGQVKTVTVGGVQSSRTDYNADARPSAVWQFGKKQYDLTYHASGASKGNVWQVTDEKNQTTAYTDYYRGVARRVDFADTRFQTASVNALGLITGVTNEAGFTTSYGYYAHGRLQTITYPTADSAAWNTKNFVFERVNAAEYGIATGHWRQTVSQGNARTVNYYDALWRPVVTRTYDTGNVSGTERMVLSRFDHTGKATFAAYPRRTICTPSTTISNCIIDSAVVGVQSSYDALGRLASTQAASELGSLTTSIAYLTGYQKQVTNPRGFVTTTSYQLFDEPSEDAPTTISEPLATTTAITRDGFGLPTAMTRSGTYLGSPISATRSYVYDSNKRLCKTIEPESGATVVNYDLAGNVTWRAAGQALSSTTDCQQASVAANQKTSYGYDSRNRLTDTTYGDGSPSISTSYTADGLPWTVSSDGSLWTYGYNKRRLLESENLSLGALSYNIGHTYSVNGHESSLTYPSGAVVNYFVNALGESTRAGSYAFTVTRHPNGAVANFAYGNGIAHTGTQTQRGLPDLSSDASVSLNVLDDDYDWDANGNVTAILSGIGAGATRTMQYDARDRLTQTNYDKLGPAQVDFTYDPLDNLRTYVTPFRNHTHEYNATTNRLTRIYEQVGSTQTNKYQYGYAAGAGDRGNVTSRAKLDDGTSQLFTFDQGNRMRALAGTASETYTYDGWGRRSLVVNGTTWKTQVYSKAGQLVHVETRYCAPAASCPRTALQEEYAYLDRHVVGKQKTGGASSLVRTYLHTDGLGSPVAETDTSGALVADSRSLQEPYGLLVYGPTAQGIGYTGHVRDEASGLSYMQQRYYDTIAGRFLSVDPVESSAGSFNRYWYANNNPYSYIDPDGRAPEWLNYIMGRPVEPSSTSSQSEFYASSLKAEVQRNIDTAPQQALEAAKVIGTAAALSPIGEVALAGGGAIKLARTIDAAIPSRTAAGVNIGSSAAEARAALEAAGYPGAPLADSASSGSGTIHNVPNLKMDVRVYDTGGTHHGSRLVTNVQGSKQLKPLDGGHFGNVDKGVQRTGSHIYFKDD